MRRPFFLFLHYMDTHGPYQPKKGIPHLNKVRAELLYRKAVKEPGAMTERERQTLLGWYKEEIAYLDGQMGKLFREMDRRGDLDNTLVVVTADHGDEFGEHGRFNHHSTLYDELLHVPLLVKLPAARHAGKVVAKPVALIQVVPTILDVAGVRADHGFDGKSLLPLIERDDERCLHELLISEAKFMPNYKACIRSEGWKLILDLGDQRRELYNLEEDPGELSNVVKGHPEIARHLEAKLLEHESNKAPEESEISTPNVEEEVMHRLRDLGYL
jgi:arylsulfatase